ncbi:dynein regulatory complex subunit 6-like [Haliotis rufescens]|uniref:dynein regulatory complex subunit 6-like n=1 Tax=Haliotis rufescens TaxID=6454 RepID=UPI00201F863B|nr:dynein regulatory complex subunit 6-like [Haliotis rufescens]
MSSPDNSLVLCDLPHTVLLHIFSFLEIQDIINIVRQTCKLWYELSYDRYLWKHLDLDHIGDHLTDQSFLTLLDSVSHHVEKLDFGMAVHLTDGSFMHKNISCPQMKSINFSLTTVSNASIAYLAEKYPDLEGIEINDCSYINIYNCLGYLSTLKKLKSVSFDDFGCSAEPERLNRKLKELFVSCPRLETIVIDSEELSDDALASLFENCPNIKSFVLAHCQYISQDAFIGIKGTATNLVNVGLAYTPVEDKVLKVIAESSPYMKELDITGCIHITDIGVGHVADNCPNLEKLIGNRLHHEGGCNITNVGLSSVASGCPKLKILDVNFCDGVTDTGITAVAEHCPRLTEIGLSGCVGITDRAVIALAEHCQWLYHVNLTECIHVTSKSIILLVAKCRWLSNLSLETCHYLAKINLDEYLGSGVDTKNTGGCRSKTITDDATEKRAPRATEESSLESVPKTSASVTSTSHPDEDKNLGAAGVECDPSVPHSGQVKSPTGVQTFSTIGSSLCMDLSGDSGLSLVVQPLLPNSILIDEGGKGMSACCVSECSPASATDPPEDDTSQLAEVAYVNRFFPHPNHSHLTSIHLSFCSKIANDSIKQLAKHCPDLMYVSLRGCFLITDTAVEVLVRSCHNLHFLDISGGSAIQSMRLTNGSLIAVANYSKSLKSLMICRNKLITLDGLQRILRDCKSLIGVWVTVGDQLRITFSGVLELVKDIDDRYVKITNTSQVEANGKQGNLCISLIPKKTPHIRLLQV